MAMFENISEFFKRFMQSEKKELLAENTTSQSKETAKDRLHVVLMQDRANVSADFLELMKEEIIEVIKKYIVVDETKIDVRLTNEENDDGSIGVPLLHANIPILNIRNDLKGEYMHNGSSDKIEGQEELELDVEKTQFVPVIKEIDLDTETKDDTIEVEEQPIIFNDNSEDNLVENTIEENNSDEEIKVEENNEEKNLAEEASVEENNENLVEETSIEENIENENLTEEINVEENFNEENINAQEENSEYNDEVSLESKIDELDDELDDDDDVTFDDLLKAAEEEEERLKQLEADKENKEEKKDKTAKKTKKTTERKKKTSKKSEK